MENKIKKRKERMTDYTEKEIETRFYRKGKNTGNGKKQEKQQAMALCIVGSPDFTATPPYTLFTTSCITS